MNVIWDEQTCIHSGKCVQGLPQVFKVEDGKFVIDPDGADDSAIRAQVAECPSGALKVE